MLGLNYVSITVACITLCSLSTLVESQTRVRLASNDIANWVSKISTDLEAFRNSFLDASNLENAFNANGVRGGNVNITQAARVLNTVKDRLQNLLWKRETQVETIRSRAEQLFANYSARNYSCSDFTTVPYNRATAVVKLDSSAPAATPAPGSSVDYCSQNVTLDLSQDPLVFDAETNINVSTAHVPQYVYDASNQILNVANWTNTLENQMRLSVNSDPTLQWQYFGTSQGLMKIFPGVRWAPQTTGAVQKGLPMDPFDCRSQNWYLMSATYPKDVVLLIDNSGSMKGAGSIMANRTLSELLGTLTANDYFNVLLVMGQSPPAVSYVANVYNRTMLQATDENKNKVLELLNEDKDKGQTLSRVLKPQGLADLGVAFSEAFEILRFVRQNNTAISAGGVQAIAMVTDCAWDDFAAVFQKYNPDRQIRLFTFLMGQEATDAPLVKSMACSNRGYFSQVSAMAETKESVLRCISVLARTNSISRQRFFTWSDVHQNQIVTLGMPDKAKNALFVSVSQAAYDVRNSTPPEDMIGVAGVDLSVDQFDRRGPAWELGPLAYMFIVNNNGFVIYHPELRTLDSSGNALLFYNSRDIANIEVPVDAMSNLPDYNLGLRTALVLQQASVFEFARIRVYDDNTRSLRVGYRYLTTPLISSSVTGVTRQTPYSLGLALPWRSGQQWPQPPAYSFNASLTGAGLTAAQIGALLTNRLTPIFVENLTVCQQQPASLEVALADFEFCDFTRALRQLYNASAICAAARVLALNRAAQTGMQCSTEFLDRLRVDAESSKNAPAAWRAGFGQASSSAPARLLGATGGHAFLWVGGSGLARWLVDPSSSSGPIDSNFLTQRWRNGSRDQLYERTVAMATEESTLGVALTPPSAVTVAANAASNLTFPRAFPVYLTAPVRVSGSVVAVAGAELDYAKLETYFIRATNSCSENASCVTCSAPSMSCYLLDTSGIVVFSKLRLDVGKSFDLVRCEAMQAMVNMSLFERMRFNDYQSVCFKRPLISSSASSLFSPIKAVMRLFYWILVEGFLILSDLSNSLFSQLYTDAQWTNRSLAVTMVYANRATIGCQLYSLLQANATAISARLEPIANVSCWQDFSSGTTATCPSDIYVRPVAKSNLIFVAVVQDTGCGCQGCSPLTGARDLPSSDNYTLNQRPRSKPHWTRSGIRLTDNSTQCTSVASQLKSTSTSAAVVSVSNLS